jgi:hypothetical protein
MDISQGCVHVLGTGHLAAAVRVLLRKQRGERWLWPDYTLSCAGDGACAASACALLVACADFECAPSFADANRRAHGARSPLLFACLTGHAVKVGPLVVPFETACFECHATQRWDFSPSEIPGRFMSWRARVTPPDVEVHLKTLAQFGALLLARELAALRFGAPLTRLAGCVAKFDPPNAEPERLSWSRALDCPVCGAVQPGIPATRGRVA